MQILTEDELVAKLDFRRPLNPVPEERPGAWPIPFEYGACEKGTKISIAKAKQIAAELRAEVAEAEKRELYAAFKQEEKRSAAIGAQYSQAMDEKFTALAELAVLKNKHRRVRTKARA